MLRVSSSGVDKIFKMLEGSKETPKRVVDIWGIYTERDAKLLCPVKTGRLRSSIKYRKLGQYSGEVYTNVEYAAFVHEGTKAHIISPRNKRFLAWKDPASPFAVQKGKYKGWVFCKKSVKHPGYRGKPFMSAAAEKVFDDIIAGRKT